MLLLLLQGGVWWNDSNNGGGQAQLAENKKQMKISSMEGLYVGQVAQDPLFLEAEKLGLDIRDSKDGVKSDKTMLFSFFSSDDAGISMYVCMYVCRTSFLCEKYLDE